MEHHAEKITDSELEIMKILWDAEEPLPLTDIRKALQSRFQWSDPTVKTLLRRLCEKNAVVQEKRNVYYYAPAISKEEFEGWAARDVVNRLFRGSAQNLIAALVKSNGLTEEDIRQLREMFKVED